MILYHITPNLDHFPIWKSGTFHEQLRFGRACPKNRARGFPGPLSTSGEPLNLIYKYITMIAPCVPLAKI